MKYQILPLLYGDPVCHINLKLEEKMSKIELFHIMSPFQ